jgi:hypothetical protein
MIGRGPGLPDVWWFMQACALLPTVRADLTSRPVRVLATADSGGPLSAHEAPETIVRAVTRAARWLPGGYTCLEQALVARRLLARCGVKASVAMGMKRLPDGELSGHAWLEHEGRTLMGSGDGFERLAWGLGGERL